MHARFATRRALVLAPLLLAGLAGLADACSVPVFRYALERWSPDDYHAYVFHRGPMTAGDQAALAILQSVARTGVNPSAADARPANLKIERVDVDRPMSPPAEAIWKSQKRASLPWLVVRGSATPTDVLAAPLAESAVRGAFDSPLRRQIARRLLDGETAVWILLECGDAPRDEAAFRLLQSEVRKSRDTLKLPEISAEDRSAGLVSIDPSELRIAFTVVRLSRTDPAEQFLVRSLLASEDDLGEYASEPIAFPVFGRGRVLFALVGPGLNADQIGAAGKTLVGECTCQIKEQNPGTDLLMSVDWDRQVSMHSIVRTHEPVLTGLASHTVDRAATGDSAMAAARGDSSPAGRSTAVAPAAHAKPPGLANAHRFGERPAAVASSASADADADAQSAVAANASPVGWSVLRNAILAVGFCAGLAAATGAWLLKRKQ